MPATIDYDFLFYLFIFQVKIWFQNRRTKWKKQENLSNAEAAEHRISNDRRSDGGRQKSNSTSGQSDYIRSNGTPLISGQGQLRSQCKRQSGSVVPSQNSSVPTVAGKLVFPCELLPMPGSGPEIDLSLKSRAPIVGYLDDNQSRICPMLNYPSNGFTGTGSGSSPSKFDDRNTTEKEKMADSDVSNMTCVFAKLPLQSDVTKMSDFDSRISTGNDVVEPELPKMQVVELCASIYCENFGKEGNEKTT